MTQFNPILTITVTTSDGVDTNHTFLVPADGEEMKTLFDELAGRIVSGMLKDVNTPLYLSNPSVIYNPDYVARVRYDVSRRCDETPDNLANEFDRIVSSVQAARPIHRVQSE